jgi:hypothetical protein
MSADYAHIRMKIVRLDVDKLKRQSERTELVYTDKLSSDHNFLVEELSYYVVSEEDKELPSDEQFIGERQYHINHDNFDAADLVRWAEGVGFVGVLLYFDGNSNPLTDGYIQLRRGVNSNMDIRYVEPELNF